MVQISYIITLISACFGLLVLIFGFSGAQSAPQEAAATALAIALAVIPYVFSRCLQISADRARSIKDAAALLDAIRSLKNDAAPVGTPWVAPVGIGSGSPAPQRAPTE